MESQDPLPITRAVDNWLVHVRQRYSLQTQRSYTSIIRRFERYAPEHISDLTIEDIERYLDSLGVSNGTFNTHVNVIKSFCHWLEDRFDLPNPSRKIKKLRAHSQQRVLTIDEYEKVLAVCNNRERDMVLFLANTGLRADEFLRLSASSISHDSNFLHIIGKGQKRRVVPLNRTCRDIVDRHPNLKFTKGYMQLYRTCQSLGARAAIRPFGSHALRHYFATELMRKGVNIYRISKILGHYSVTVTESTYLHFLAEIDLAQVTDCLD